MSGLKNLRNFDINLSTFFSLKNKKLSIEKAYVEGVYADTPANRKLGRVGMSYAAYANKLYGSEGKEGESIGSISLYRLGKLLNDVSIEPMRITDHKDYFLISLEDEDFRDEEKIGKTKEVLEKLGAKVYVAKKTHFIKAYKKDISIEEGEEELYQIGDFKFDVNARELITKGGEKISLTPKETELLSLFAANPNQLLSRDTLLEKVWGESNYYNSRSMDVYITRLREKLSGDKDIKISSISWKGYKLTLPKKKAKTTISEEETIKNIVDKTTILKNAAGKKLDHFIEYTNSAEGVEGVRVKEGATDQEKREAIANFFMNSLNKNEEEAANDLDTIFEEGLEDYVPTKKETKGSSQDTTLRKINKHFGFEDEESSWFADTPIALTMANDDEFGEIIEEFTDYHILSQSGSYKNDGTRSNMLSCNVEYEIVPKDTADEDVEAVKKTFIIDNKTTIKNILSQLGKRY